MWKELTEAGEHIPGKNEKSLVLVNLMEIFWNFGIQDMRTFGVFIRQEKQKILV